MIGTPWLLWSMVMMTMMLPVVLLSPSPPSQRVAGTPPRLPSSHSQQAAPPQRPLRSSIRLANLPARHPARTLATTSGNPKACIPEPRHPCSVEILNWTPLYKSALSRLTVPFLGGGPKDRRLRATVDIAHIPKVDHVRRDAVHLSTPLTC